MARGPHKQSALSIGQGLLCAGGGDMVEGTWRRALRGAADLTSIWFSGTRSEVLHLQPWLSRGVLLLVPKSQHSCHFLTVTGVGRARALPCSRRGFGPSTAPPSVATPAPTAPHVWVPVLLRPSQPGLISISLHRRHPLVSLFWLLSVVSSVAPRAGVLSRSHVHSSAGHPRLWRRLPRCRK